MSYKDFDLARSKLPLGAEVELLAVLHTWGGPLVGSLPGASPNWIVRNRLERPA